VPLALVQRLEQDNKNLLEAQLATAGSFRIAGMRMNQLSSRLTKYERASIELTRPTFDYDSAEDTELMLTSIQAEGNRLAERLDKLESSLARKFKDGAPSLRPPSGSLAEAVDGYRLTLTYLEARVDSFTGSSDPQSFSFGRLQDLEIEREQLRQLLAQAEQENDTTQRYVESAVQPVMNENTFLKSQLAESARRAIALQEILAKKEKAGIFW